MNHVELPTKYSELLRLAVWDAIATENTPGYVLDMTLWHELPEDDDVPVVGQEGLCRVCMAGAVLANTFHVPREMMCGPSYIMRQDERASNALWAIDAMRCGLVPKELDHDPRLRAEAMHVERILEPIRSHFEEMNADDGDENWEQRAPWSMYLHAADRMQVAGL